MSDLEYIASNQANRPALANIIFIGGPNINRVMGMICGTTSTNTTTTSSNPIGNSSSNSLPLLCKLPHTLSFQSNSFDFNEATYDQPDHSMIFTLPFYRLSKAELKYFLGNTNHHSINNINGNTESIAMGVCLHANSIQGYLHLSRLVWSVVPPMVRAPFETYIPDYMVLSGNNIWGRGMGAVEDSGFWDNDCKPQSNPMLYK